MANAITMRNRKPKSTTRRPGRKEVRLRAQNQKLLRWLDSWFATPDDQSTEWWNDFEADLHAQAVTFPPTEAR